MAWEQIIAVVTLILGAGGGGAFIASWRSSKTAADGAALDRTIKALDETREDVARLTTRQLTLEDQYHKLWDQYVALQREHAQVQLDLVTSRAEVVRLQVRVADLERTAAAPGTGSDA
ncbi:MAG: hypothetical protein ABI780_09705 [Ardenticatenales bacterium]